MRYPCPQSGALRARASSAIYVSPRPGPIKHGTIYAYKDRGCRCDACQTANRETCRAERRRRGVMPLGNPCQIGDRQFSSQMEAAQSAKKSKSAINCHLDRHGNLDRLGAKPVGPNNGMGKPVHVGRYEWPFRSALGLGRAPGHRFAMDQSGQARRPDRRRNAHEHTMESGMTPFRILIVCGTSGVMHRACAARGHNVWSCDLLAAEDGNNRHIQGDVRNILDDGWDLMAVMHPPCTRLCRSGRCWMSGLGKWTPPKQLPKGRTWERHLGE